MVFRKWKKIEQIDYILYRFGLWRHFGRSYFTQRMLWTRWCGMRSNQDHFGKGQGDWHKINISCPVHIKNFFREKSELLASYKDHLWPEVIWASLRLLAGKLQNLCSVHIPLMEKHWSSYFLKDCLLHNGVSWFCVEII